MGLILTVDYGARARAGGTCLVAVLHTASVIWWWLAAPIEHPQHPIWLAAGLTRMQYRHKTCATSPGPGPIDSKYINTKHPPPLPTPYPIRPIPHAAAGPRSGSHRRGDTPAAPKRRVGPVDGPPQPIWPIIGPPKLAPRRRAWARGTVEPSVALEFVATVGTPSRQSVTD